MDINKKDVTNKVEFGWNDDEALPIGKCVCGHEFKPWEFHISIYDDNPDVCPYCGAKLFFRSDIRVYQVIENE